MQSIKRHIRNLALSVAAIGLCVGAALMQGCATTTATNGTTTLQQQVAAFCAIAPNEVQAFVAGAAALPVDAQKALPAIQQAVAATCAPGVVTSTTDLQTFVAVTLPAFTTIALEYAAAQKAAK